MEQSPGPSRTAAATAARMRKRQERLADELRAAGWTVTPPEPTGGGTVRLPEVHQDSETRAVYVRLDGRMGCAIGQTKEVAPGVNLDYDTDGRLVGVEII